jgi:hypothetical protein
MMLEEFIHRLVTRPDEAFIHINGQEAFVYDTERDTILHLQGNFRGLREKVAWEVRHAIAEQHPITS